MKPHNELQLQRVVHVRVIQTINNFPVKQLHCLKGLRFKQLRKSASGILIFRQKVNKKGIEIQ